MKINYFYEFYIFKPIFDIKNLQVVFKYCFDNIEFFEETIHLDKNFETIKNLDNQILDNILSNISIAIWISYYKLFPTNKIILNEFVIDDYQKKFWNEFYFYWLWEFFYKNNLDIKHFQKIDFVCNWNINNFQKIDFKLSEKAIVPIGWWKDSNVSIELLKQNKIDFDIFSFCSSDKKIYQDIQNISWKKRLIIQRKISQNLIKLNKNWYYNWHVPISWIISFVLILISYLYNYKYIVFSNEKSANYWNVIYNWIKINHQYSKSYEFEKKFRNYTKKYINWNIEYFSILRPYFEIKIIKLFSKFPQYFDFFSSCNRNFEISKINNEKIWCWECPKCVYVYPILRMYIWKEKTNKIFWKDLFENESLIELFETLIWIKWFKPFECVWTIDESLYSIYSNYKSFTKQKKLDNTKILPIILKKLENYLKNISSEKIKKIRNKFFKKYNTHCIPKHFL